MNLQLPLSFRRLLVLLLFASTACTRSAPANEKPAAPTGDDAASVVVSTDDEDLYYGVYLNKQKVGWMRVQTITADTVEKRVMLKASLRGMGQVSSIEMNERRLYDRRSRRLKGVSFAQKADTGSVRVEGEVDGEQLALRVTAGNAVSEQRVSVAETLDDVEVEKRLAQKPEIGRSIRFKRFDGSIQKSVVATATLLAREKRFLGGVAADVFQVETNYADLGIVETSWIDARGKILETKVGGFFLARLEPPEVAKQIDSTEDVLVSAVIKPPRPLTQPESMERLKLTFEGFGESLPPHSPRQVVKAQGAKVHLELQRDPSPPTEMVGKARPDFDEFLKPTAFIQSDDPKIREAAKKAAGGATDIFTAVTRLSHFVYEHVRDEYVPAYSNALDALESERGDCTEHSILFVALARALGIPARVAVGIAYWPIGGGFGWHAWSEVNIAGRWYSVDPTWDQPIADATHIKLSGGGPAEQARIVMLMGRLRIVEMQ